MLVNDLEGILRKKNVKAKVAVRHATCLQNKPFHDVCLHFELSQSCHGFWIKCMANFKLCVVNGTAAQYWTLACFSSGFETWRFTQGGYQPLAQSQLQGPGLCICCPPETGRPSYTSRYWVAHNNCEPIGQIACNCWRKMVIARQANYRVRNVKLYICVHTRLSQKVSFPVLFLWSRWLCCTLVHGPTTVRQVSSPVLEMQRQPNVNW